MKRLTGGDAIRARRMRQDFIEFAPSHTALLITNHLPKVSGDDAAIWRRLRVVPFDVVIPESEQDGTLGEQLELEADAILAWAVAGYRDYVARGGLDEPAASQGHRRLSAHERRGAALHRRRMRDDATDEGDDVATARGVAAMAGHRRCGADVGESSGLHSTVMDTPPIRRRTASAGGPESP